ncbi:PREDICTED: dihydrolipoyllysine-residue acetyltransferase component 4 of pyruvate dehydrogenase complex, chloroplastic-like [Tarenaya hassleriana]|uniref:dihydrolipoyllysine-residue acetyltransferase component 4 of pyruvate dehydrogenase complex, chloroplastic-like n=1 Tax=Tarenaya hassleriana TaxID=28532 RepID=UPI00053C6095|nr:PREDICTED: dihydrolipoyllysine-residue acetyltransferase component 4 of pyruvate dehydrogenase complex, chloroplastic-like [Tarenaya hassleriana]
MVVVAPVMTLSRWNKLQPRLLRHFTLLLPLRLFLSLRELNSPREATRAAASSFLSTPSLSNSKSTISFSSCLSVAPVPCLRRIVFRSPSPASSRRRPMTVQSKIREIFMPALSSTMTEGKIVSWIKSEGEKLAKGESVVVVESDKADMDVETFYDGYLAAIVVGEGETAPVGAAIGLLAETEAEIEEAKAKAASKSSSPTVPAAAEAVTSPPPATSTPAPAISPPVAAPAKASASNLPPPLPDSSVVPFTTMQAAVSKNMVESLSVPTFRVGYPVATDALDALYEKVKPKGVTMTALLAKAAAMALAQHPVVNATCKDGKSFTYNSNINIAVAVAINGGLITPVLQDADKLDLYLLSQKWKELVGKARSKQLQPHEYNSGTFTLSNLGMFGVDRFDAILPPGQGAIMAVGASKPTVIADSDGFFSVKNKMLVNVTADHRIIYGADLAAFLQTFAKIVENPDSLTL